MLGSSVRQADIRAAIRDLSLDRLPLCVHSSLSSFGWVDGGANTVVEGLLAEGCTVLVPSFSSAFEVMPPAGRRYQRNGIGDDPLQSHSDASDLCYSVDSSSIDVDLGVVPAEVLRSNRRVRGDHPLNSFAAIGTAAHALIDGQEPMHVYAPLEALADQGGWVLLMGVDLTRMTLIHLAEERAGRTLFRRWARDCTKGIVECQLGSCSEGFERLRPAVSSLERTARVGASEWRAYPAADVLEIAAATIRREPSITHCPDPECVRCNDAVLGGPIIEAE